MLVTIRAAERAKATPEKGSKKELFTVVMVFNTE